MTSLGELLNDAIYDRITTLSLGVDLKYRGQQAGTNEYILFLDDDERYAPAFSDKDDDANDLSTVLQLWGSKARTLSARAKTIIDDIADKSNPPTVAGFTHILTELERNQRTPQFTTTGEDSQESRVIQFRFIYYPT